jgi:hypothetical protein
MRAMLRRVDCPSLNIEEFTVSANGQMETVFQNRNGISKDRRLKTFFRVFKTTCLFPPTGRLHRRMNWRSISGSPTMEIVASRSAMMMKT